MAADRWEKYEDAELVVEVLMGNTAAFDGLVARYRAAVLATVLRQVPARPVAEEICQEAFIRAFRALPRLRDPFRFAAWLHAIARREVIRQAPAEKRAADHASLDEPGTERAGEGEASAWESLERQEEREQVRQAMAALPEEFQLVLTLRYWAEMPLEQIAAYLGRPLTTVKWRLHRARALMRQRLLDLEDGRVEDRRNQHGTARERQQRGTEAHRAHARNHGGDGAGRRADRQPGRAQHGCRAQL